MNLPNKLTILRVIMIPFFVAFLMLENGANTTYRYIAAALFIIASLTDLLDGKIARKYNLVTNFGKFMDPLADKLLVCSALICMIELGQLVLLILNIPALSMVTDIVIWIAVALTVISLVDYIVKNAGVLKEGKM